MSYTDCQPGSDQLGLTSPADLRLAGLGCQSNSPHQVESRSPEKQEPLSGDNGLVSERPTPPIISMTPSPDSNLDGGQIEIPGNLQSRQCVMTEV